MKLTPLEAARFKKLQDSVRLAGEAGVNIISFDFRESGSHIVAFLAANRSRMISFEQSMPYNNGMGTIELKLTMFTS